MLHSSQQHAPSLPSEEPPRPMIGRGNLVPQPRSVPSDLHSGSERAQSCDKSQRQQLSHAAVSKTRCAGPDQSM